MKNMRTSSTFSVLFWVYASRADKNNCSTVYVRLSVNGKRVSISLKDKVNLNSWDMQRQKAKGNGVAAKRLNPHLDEVKSDIIQCHRDLIKKIKH